MNREEHLIKTFPTKDGKTYIQSLDEFNSNSNIEHKRVKLQQQKKFMGKQQIIYLIYSFGLFFLGSFGHWYIMYWQFKMPNWVKTPWPYLIAPAITFLWIVGSHYGVKAFNGEMWSNRFLFFVTGIFVAAMLYPYHFGQPFTMKTLVQLTLAFVILLVSVFWK